MSNSMTHQHFEAIAEAISTIGGINLRKKVADKLVPVLGSFNGSFDADRFRTACKSELTNNQAREWAAERNNNLQQAYTRLNEAERIRQQNGSSNREMAQEILDRSEFQQAYGGAWTETTTDEESPEHAQVRRYTERTDIDWIETQVEAEDQVRFEEVLRNVQNKYSGVPCVGNCGYSDCRIAKTMMFKRYALRWLAANN